MKNIVATLLLAAICAAQDYGVMSVCTALDGKEYCYLYPGEYRVVKIDGTLVVASGFSMQRYTSTTGESVVSIGSGATARFWEADDEFGNRFRISSGKDNLVISDTTGCATIQYVAGGVDRYRKAAGFEETGGIDDQLEYIWKCQEGLAKDSTR